MNLISFTMIASGLLWLLLSTIAIPRNDSEYPALHAWLKEASRITFAASLLVLLLLLSKAI